MPAIVSSLLVIILGILPLASLYLIKLIIDAATAAISGSGPVTSGYILLLVGIGAGIGILNSLCQHASAYFQENLSLRVSDHVHEQLHKKSIAVDLEYYENPAYFDTLRRAQAEGPYRPTSIVNGLIGLIQSSVSMTGITILLVSFHWSVPFILLCAIAPGVLIKLKYSGVMYEWQRKQTPVERKSSYLNWLITGALHAKELRLFELGELFSARFSKIRDAIRTEKLGLVKSRSIADTLAQACSTVAMFGALGFMVFQAVHGKITIGSLVMYYQGFQRGLEFFRNLLTGLAGLYEDNLFISNFFEFIDIEEKIKTPENPVSFPDPIRDGITFENVSFKYPSTENAVLSDINFTIKPDEIVALIGRNGAGKSTITKLLCRLYDPDSGTICIDQTDIKQFKISDLRGKIGVMFQDYARYHLTALENIWVGDVNSPVEGERIREAAIKADAREVIERLPHGFDTILGRMFQDGEELSQGQWQKVALARAFMRDTPLMILDEPTSSLDADSEYEIFNGFKKLLRGKSALLISHRFSTVKMADRIIVLENGSIVEQGAHDTLMSRSGAYAKWYTKQELVSGMARQ